MDHSRPGSCEGQGRGRCAPSLRSPPSLTQPPVRAPPAAVERLRGWCPRRCPPSRGRGPPAGQPAQRVKLRHRRHRYQLCLRHFGRQPGPQVDIEMMAPLPRRPLPQSPHQCRSGCFPAPQAHRLWPPPLPPRPGWAAPPPAPTRGWQSRWCCCCATAPCGTPRAGPPRSSASAACASACPTPPSGAPAPAAAAPSRARCWLPPARGRPLPHPPPRPPPPPPRRCSTQSRQTSPDSARGSPLWCGGAWW
mmetsp:Transcript_42343/g.109816  ORF Transcript_42343/g.109816 Transcript_42343/m.109816 type:complete len:249 (+) Transcript_42343:883-1629(+)